MKPEVRTAVILAALARATMQLSAAAGKGGVPKLDEGGYPVDLTITVQGDVTVGKAGEPGETTDFAEADLIGALLDELPDDNARAEAVKRAMQRIGRARTTESTAKRLEGARAAAKAQAIEIARAKGWVKPTPARAGAVTGKPAVRVTGRCGEHELAIEVAAEGVPA